MSMVFYKQLWGGSLLKVSAIVEQGSNYIKYEDGVLIHWGFYDNGNNTNDKSGITINFSPVFISKPSLILTSGKQDGNQAYRATYSNYYALSNTSALIGWYGSTASCICWIAIGRWK